MKIFWSLLLLVIVAGVAAVFWPFSSGATSDSDTYTSATPTQSIATPTASATTTAKTSTPATTTAVTPISSTPSTAKANTSATTSVPASATSPASNSNDSNKNSNAIVNTYTAPASNLAAKTKAASVVISPDSLKDGLDRKLGNAVIVPGNILKQADGSILADNKYLITGAGTVENPYRVTWECLTSASQTYIPRLQQNNIPQRVAMLDGKWIRIEGYMAFPLMLQESSEILAMLNQWDGCCIGVPPTPYDAIEVKLAVPVKPGRRHTYNFGTVTGKFKVDPYLVENWLVGLYQLESASLQSDM